MQKEKQNYKRFSVTMPADLYEELEQMAAFFHTKKGETRWGKTFDQPLYGALAYRAMNFAWRQFPSWFGGLYFDKDMNPRINTPQGIEAIKQFCSLVKYMPEDVLGWGTPQLYPFWASGQTFSFVSFPSIVGYGNNNPKSKVKGKQLPCIIPATTAPGKPVRRSAQAAGLHWSDIDLPDSTSRLPTELPLRRRPARPGGTVTSN